MPSYDVDLLLVVSSDEMKEFFEAELSETFPNMGVEVAEDIEAKCVFGEADDLDTVQEILGDYADVTNVEFSDNLAYDMVVHIPLESLWDTYRKKLA